jgi:hypothetical protein
MAGNIVVIWRLDRNCVDKVEVKPVYCLSAVVHKRDLQLLSQAEQCCRWRRRRDKLYVTAAG